MTSLIKDSSQFKLNQKLLEQILNEIKSSLSGRVKSAFVFGSASTGMVNDDSDIDLILVVESATRPFIERALDFSDLYDIYPKLDLLVYTQKELDDQLADSQLGFWKSVRLSLKKLI